jgi:hypothetical protein
VKQAESDDRQTCNITNKDSVGKGGASRRLRSGEHTNDPNVWARFRSLEFPLVYNSLGMIRPLRQSSI